MPGLPLMPPNWRRWASDANGLTGSPLELPEAPPVAPPTGLAAPPMSLPASLGPAPAKPMNLNAIQMAENAIGQMRPGPSAETMALAQKTPSTWRAVAATLADTFTPSARFAPLIAYGPKGLQARQEMAKWQEGLPQQLEGYKTLNDMYNVEADNDRLNRTADANITQSLAAAGASNASAASSRAGVAPATGDFAKRMGVPEGTPVSASVVERGTRPTTPDQLRSPTDNELKIIAQGGMPDNPWKIGQGTAKQAVEMGSKDPTPPRIQVYQNDKTGTTWLVAYDPATGQEKWRTKEESTPSRPPQPSVSFTTVPGTNMTQKDQAVFNSLVTKWEASPLAKAVDRTPILRQAIQDIRKDPANGALQYNLLYPYTQALDTYQSAVREGELRNIQAVDSVLGQLQNTISRINSRQVVSPQMMLQMADAAERILAAIDEAGIANERKFEAQALVNGNGVADAWKKWRGSFATPYDQQKPAQTGVPAVGGMFNGRKVTSVVEVKP